MRGIHVSAVLLGTFLILPAAGTAAAAAGEEEQAQAPREVHHLKVKIDSPGRHDRIDSGSIVRGTVDAPEGTEVGVTVNGSAAEVNGRHFAYSGLSPSAGKTHGSAYRILVEAIDGAGNRARDKTTAVAAEPFLAMTGFAAYPSAGQAPLAVKFALDAPPGGETALYELDYEGDGLVDATAANLEGLAASLAHTYVAEGLYAPTVSVTDGAGKKSSLAIVVNVSRVPDLKKKWGDMIAVLRAGDVTGAVGFFALSVRESYGRAFSALADAGMLAPAAAGMGDIAIVRADGETAEGDLRVVKDGKGYSYCVRFVKDTDGIWRIRSF